MRKGTAYIWLSGVALASFLAFGGSDKAKYGSVQAETSVAQTVAALLPDSMSALHGPSLAVGLILGIVGMILAQTSWHDLPQRILRWLLVNERNFYRLGMAVVCLGVLLFY